jgi:hypothetical protein
MRTIGAVGQRPARSVLGGCEHDGILIAETDDDATSRSLPTSTGRIKTRRLNTDSRRR